MGKCCSRLSRRGSSQARIQEEVQTTSTTVFLRIIATPSFCSNLISVSQLFLDLNVFLCSWHEIKGIKEYAKSLSLSLFESVFILLDWIKNCYDSRTNKTVTVTMTIELWPLKAYAFGLWHKPLILGHINIAYDNDLWLWELFSLLDYEHCL